MEEKKYELTDETIDVDGRILHRIKAIKDFCFITAGDLGGFIEKEYNLSHDNNAWVSGYAWVYDNAKVSDDARVFGNARVYGNAKVSSYAQVFDNAQVSGDAKVSGYAQVSSYAKVSGNAMVFDDAIVFGNAEVCDYTQIYGNAMVRDNAIVFDNAQVYGYSSIFDHSIVAGNSMICVDIRGYAKINQNGCIKSPDDYITFGNVGSRHGTTTMFRCRDDIIRVSCGCFSGTLEEFHDRVIKTHGDNKYEKEYETIIKVAKVHFNLI